MNMRRVGLTAFAVVVAGLLRRRLRTQSDPGPTDDAASGVDEAHVRVDEPTVATPDVELRAAARVDEVALDENVSLGDPELVDSALEPVSADPVDEVTLGAPRIGLPRAGESAEPASAPSEVTTAEPDDNEPEGNEPDDNEPEGNEPDDNEPEGNEPDDNEPEANESEDTDDPPRIVLPTMPRAGTAEIVANRFDSRATRVTLPGGPLAMGTTTGGEHPSTPPAGNAGAPAPPAASAMSTTGDSEKMADPKPTDPKATDPKATDPKPTDPTSRREPSASSPPPDRLSNPLPIWYRRRRWRFAGSVLGAIIIAAMIAASVVQLPYYSLRPGTVYNTIERVEAPVDLVSIPSGEISFVTVSQTANITPWQWIDAQLDGNVRVRHEDEVRGDQTADELREADVRRMQVSKDAAVVVALQRLGYDLVVTPIGIEVAQVFPCTAADGILGTGDLIVGVDGVDVRDGEQLVAALTEIGVGEEVELLVERIDPSNPTQSMRTDLVTLTLGSADAACLPDDVRADEPRPFIGIGTLTIVEEEFPIDIDVRTGSVGGPSAGLAFTLAIIDVLSEGELTSGLNIVATGTIDRDGNVGPVGGIQQKTVAAERSGADVFIVPACCDNFVSRSTGEPLELPSNYEEALSFADDMTVIGVNTLDEALAAIGELGGDVNQFITVTE